MSNINPGTIDNEYPVAGQDNDSQGFRDNFTIIKNNLGIARDELSDLQEKVVLKAALVGTVLNNNMGGAVLSNARLQQITETVVTNLARAGTVTLDYAQGSYFRIAETTGSVALNFSNIPVAGTAGKFRVEIDISNTAHTLTLPSTVNIGTSTIQGITGSVIQFNRTGKYVFEFEATEGSSGAMSAFDLTRNADPIYLPSVEEIDSGDAISLDDTTSTFSTTGSVKTATLAAGITGQIKVLAMTAASGNMVITVTNPAWGIAGTITFDTVGQACTLMYIDSQWFCIGNNGAVFA